ncbi:hypothetical protein HID58_058565 [Brassica napus]|uniref:Uncharacterized protein n=1 Tax=Brassica napus TaxID=3708 RepID=A0ABQ7ZQG5_BRANA|nr:hypothetical protein HID58_058565 [Brassica napus]
MDLQAMILDLEKKKKQETVLATETFAPAHEEAPVQTNASVEKLHEKNMEELRKDHVTITPKSDMSLKVISELEKPYHKEICVFACCLASVSLCAFSVTTHLARRLIVISSARICVAVSPLRAWVRAGSVQSVSKLTGSVRLFITMATPSLIRAKSLPLPSDLSLISPNLVSHRRASPTGIFQRRDRPITTATTMPCALRLCFSPVLILKPGSPSVTPSQPPEDSKYSVLSPFSTRLTGLTTTAPSDDASCSDGALGAIICQRKTLILVGLMGLGLATRMCITKITESMLSTGSPSRPLPLVYRPSPNPKRSLMEIELFMFFGLFNALTNPFAWVYQRRLQLWQFVSGIQVKIIQGFLHIELASPTNISILCFCVLFVVHLTVEINSGFIVLPSSIVLVVST